MIQPRGTHPADGRRSSCLSLNPALSLFDREVRRLSAERAEISAQLVVLVESARRMLGVGGNVSLACASGTAGYSCPASILDHLRLDGELTLVSISPNADDGRVTPSTNVIPDENTPPAIPSPSTAFNDSTNKPPAASQGPIRMTSSRPAVVQTLHRVSKGARREDSPPPANNGGVILVPQTETPPPPSLAAVRPQQGVVLLPSRDLRRSTSRAPSSTTEGGDETDETWSLTTSIAPKPQPRLPLHPTSSTGDRNQQFAAPSSSTPLASQPSSRSSSVAKELSTFDVDDAAMNEPNPRTHYTEDSSLLRLLPPTAHRSIRFGDAFQPTTAKQHHRPAAVSSRHASSTPRSASTIEAAVVSEEGTISGGHVPSAVNPFLTCRSSRGSSEEKPSTTTGGSSLVVVRRQSTSSRPSSPSHTQTVAATSTVSQVAPGREWMFPTSAGRPRLH